HRKNWPGSMPARSRSRPFMMIDRTPGPSNTTLWTRNAWRALNRTGSMTRHQRIAPNTRTYRPTHHTRAARSLSKSLPAASWGANERAIARYTYRWTKYQVSRFTRRRAARIDTTATVMNNANAAHAIRMSGSCAMSHAVSCTTFVGGIAPRAHP